MMSMTRLKTKMRGVRILVKKLMRSLQTMRRRRLRELWEEMFTMKTKKAFLSLVMKELLNAVLTI